MEKLNNIIIFGAGAIGSNLLMNLVRDLPDVRYVVVDYDKIEQRNFTVGTQPYLKSDLNKYKTQALQMLVYNQCGKRIETVNEKMMSKNQIYTILSRYHQDEYDSISQVSIPEISLVVDAFDNAESRNLIKIKDGGIHVVHIGFSPQMTGSIIWDENWNDMSKSKNENTTDICTQQGARSFIMSFTSIASLVILTEIRTIFILIKIII
jgi:tRNA A37 threonylcarbamoyladenosine dehydratase